ncbi:hypothetical protein lerEdw1_019907 [Lerista edwardsae]|nr:hypothetical protein lerEdw1_019907 [Lerista edwardsae]
MSRQSHALTGTFCAHWLLLQMDTEGPLVSPSSGWMLRLVQLLLALPPVVCNVHPWRCPASDPLPVPHEWYQPGDTLIGGIASLVNYVFFEHSFKEQPSKKMFDLPR